MDAALQDLAGCRVLLVEDEYFIADDLGRLLSVHGAVLTGPVPNLEIALALVQAEECIDGAVIDINLRSQLAFPVADALEARGVPLLFETGHSASTVPARYRHVTRWEKPCRLEDLVQALPALIHRS